MTDPHQELLDAAQKLGATLGKLTQATLIHLAMPSTESRQEVVIQQADFLTSFKAYNQSVETLQDAEASISKKELN
ncbi:hypothetical protein [Cerasicoccus fimbriatus]|uniref:hypothetical protein n=1 Tax=Cerasicoccus fimbriatus TaxID=3014554 RepID=UPI0022B5A092|nr:hypothetical protein [Cerasicoccus sp. TK19100]